MLMADPMGLCPEVRGCGLDSPIERIDWVSMVDLAG